MSLHSDTLFWFRANQSLLFLLKADDEVRLILDQHAELDFFYSASSVKQHSAGRHVTPLGHTILIQSQSLLFLLKAACLAEKQQIPIL
jgi:hypothetical protein